MCMKKIKDILFPTNLLGKNKKSFAYRLDYVPAIDFTKTVNVVWSGKRLDITYTTIEYPRRPGYSPTPDEFIYTPFRYTYKDGDEDTRVIETPFVRTNHVIDVISHSVFFNCTNVTSLVVNGEQLI